MTLYDIISNESQQRLTPAADYLKSYGICYDPNSKMWVYPTPELPGIKEAGERAYQSLDKLITGENLYLSVLANWVDYRLIQELDTLDGSILFHELGLVKNHN